MRNLGLMAAGGLAWVLTACGGSSRWPSTYGVKHWVGDHYSAAAYEGDRRASREQLEAYWEEENRRGEELWEARRRAASQPPPPSDAESCVESGRKPNPAFVAWQEQRAALDAKLEAIQAQLSGAGAREPGVELETVETQSTHRTSDDFRRGERGTTVVGKSQRETGASAGRRAAWSYEQRQLLAEEEQVIEQIRRMPSPPQPCNF